MCLGPFCIPMGAVCCFCAIGYAPCPHVHHLCVLSVHLSVSPCAACAFMCAALPGLMHSELSSGSPLSSLCGPGSREEVAPAASMDGSQRGREGGEGGALTGGRQSSLGSMQSDGSSMRLGSPTSSFALRVVGGGGVLAGTKGARVVSASGAQRS